MNKGKWISVLLLIGIFTACGSEAPTFAPEACLEIDDQEIFVGATEQVPICFEDPDGGLLTIIAVSSDRSIVTATVTPSTLALEAISIGQAVITITATDPDADMTEQIVNVTVPNRAPEVVKIAMLRLFANSTLNLDLATVFTDPDGQVLTYEVRSLDTDILSVTLTGSTAVLKYEGAGISGIEVTATDPGGLSVTGSISVSTLSPTSIVRDEFDTDRLNPQWRPDQDTDTRIEDGRLRISVNKSGGNSAYMSRSVSASNWQVSMNIENVTDDMWGGFWITTTDVSIPELAFIFGANLQAGIGNRKLKDETNFAFLLHDGLRYRIEPGWYGNFDEIIGSGVAADLRVVTENNGYTIYINDVKILRINPNNTFGSLPMDMQEIALLSWPADDTFNSMGGSWIDWIEVSGYQR